jgi:hypothetical protein
MLKPLKMYPKSLFKKKGKSILQAGRRPACLKVPYFFSSAFFSSAFFSSAFFFFGKSLPPRRLPQNEGGAFSL